MTDNIMPHSYFHTLLPELERELPGLHIFYEQKANLTLDQVIALRGAGVPVIQPGIEALSTSLLRRMGKGVTARQNIGLLRYARSAELALNWNLLYGFPGDVPEDYEETLSLLPLLRHLNPPGGLYHLSIDRFSPYFDHPERYGVRNIRPMDSYRDVLPAHADVSNIAYHFVADYDSACRQRPEIIEALRAELKIWREQWQVQNAAPPALAVTALDEDTYLLIDTRGLANQETVRFLDREEASIVLTGRRLDCAPDLRWATDLGLLVQLDSYLVPLATAEPDLLNALEQEGRLAARRPIRQADRSVSLEVIQ